MYATVQSICGNIDKFLQEQSEERSQMRADDSQNSGAVAKSVKSTKSPIDVKCCRCGKQEGMYLHTCGNWYITCATIMHWGEERGKPAEICKEE